VVIVGGGFGGLRAARALADDAHVAVTLVDRRNFHLFQPLLYQVATGGLSPGEIAVPLRHVLRRQANARTVMATVTDIDMARRRVRMHSAGCSEDEPEVEMSYDSLVIAAGSETGYFGHDEWREHSLGLKSLEDALRTRRRVLCAFEEAEVETDADRRQALLTFVVAGGGPTGVELAGQFAEIARETMRDQFRAFDPALAHVVVVEAAERILPQFAPAHSARATRDLVHLGVDVRTSTRVRDIRPGEVDVEDARGVHTLRGSTILWAAGVTAADLVRDVAHANSLSTDRGGRIVVDATLNPAGHRDVYVVGDACAIDGHPLPGLAPVAMQMGEFAAGAIRGRLDGRYVAPFRYHDRGVLATIGRGRAVAQIGRLRAHGAVAWVLWLLVHIAFLIGFQNRVIVLVRWAWNFATRGRGARLITRGE
jgi:NADH:ubiquinone reductase (H+-translocating)